MHAALRNTLKVVTAIAKATKTPDIPASQILTLLHIADRGEMPLADLEKLTGVGQSSVSRNAIKPAQGRSPDEPGMGFAELYEDPYYRRRKLLRITAKGKLFIQQLEKEVTGVTH